MLDLGTQLFIHLDARQFGADYKYTHVNRLDQPIFLSQMHISEF